MRWKKLKKWFSQSGSGNIFNKSNFKEAFHPYCNEGLTVKNFEFDSNAMTGQLNLSVQDEIDSYNDNIHTWLIKMTNIMREKGGIDFNTIYQNISKRIHFLINISKSASDPLPENDITIENKDTAVKSKKVLEFIKSSYWHWTSGNNIEYYVPDVDEFKIKFDQKHLIMVDKIIYLDDFIPPNFCKEDKKWINTKSGSYSESFTPIYLKRQKMNTNDKFSFALAQLNMRNYNKEVKDAHSISFEYLYNSVISKYLSDIKEGEASKQIVKSIKDFEWNDIKALKRRINQHFCKEKEIILSTDNSFLNTNSKNKKQKVSNYAELSYGSWCCLFEEIPRDDEEKECLCNQIVARVKAIKYLIKNPIIMKNKCEEILNKTLQFVVDEMERSSINPFGQKVIGWQSGTKYSKDTIYLFPFECILCLNSTSGRMMVLNHWKNLVSHPDFVKQKTCEHVYNFTIESDPKASSILTNNSTKQSQRIKETRLHLVFSVQRQIVELVTKLRPVLTWRLLVEKQLQNMQNESSLVENTTKTQEEDAYVLLVLCMYNLALLKHEGFNPERYLRMKLHCRRCESRKNAHLSKHSCLCCFGMDLKSVKRTAINGEKRTELIKNYCSKYFELNSEKGCYVPKEEAERYVKESMKINRIDIDCLKEIEKKFNKKIII